MNKSTANNLKQIILSRPRGSGRSHAMMLALEGIRTPVTLIAATLQSAEWFRKTIANKLVTVITIDELERLRSDHRPLFLDHFVLEQLVAGLTQRPIVEKMPFITREMVRANRNCLFVFGDNIKRAGLGGQAKEMRGEINSHGIVTKNAPNNADYAFFSDKYFNTNCEFIEQDFRQLYERMSIYDKIIVPASGIGTGMAELDKRAPRTFAYLQELWKTLLGEK